MDITGATVFHDKYGKGIISEVTPKFVIVFFEDHPAEAKKFKYPLCFEKMLRFENEEYNSAIAEEIQNKQEEIKILEEKDKEAQRQGIHPLQSIYNRVSTRAERRSVSVNNTHDIRCNNLKGLAAAKTISIEDNYEFDRIVDVMNGIFGWNYGACMKGFYYINDSKTIGAWFPKMAIIENGIEKAQSITKAWINVLSADGKEIRMYTKDPYLSSVKYHAEPHITFAKFPGEPYRYIGTFDRDLPRCTPTDIRFVRIATSFDIAESL